MSTISTKGLFSATMALAFSVLAMAPAAQPQHAEHHQAQGSQAADDPTATPCPMMGGMSGGGMMRGGMKGGEMGMGGMMMGMGGMMMGLDTANLSDREKEQLAALHGRQAQEHFMLMMEMKEAQQQLQALRSAQPLDVDAIEQAYDQLAQARKEMFVSHVRARQQIQEIVGPQQQSGTSQEAPAGQQ